MGIVTCAHCDHNMVGYAQVGDYWLCHPDEGLDCYRLVTVYHHDMPCHRPDCLDLAGRSFQW